MGKYKRRKGMEASETLAQLAKGGPVRGSVLPTHLWEKAKMDPDVIAARLSDGGVLYMPQDHECDDTWKLKLRILRNQINQLGGDPEVAQVIEDNPYKHGYYSAIEAAMLLIHAMLGPDEEDQ